MKVELKDYKFKPFTIEITIESKKEMDVFMEIDNFSYLIIEEFRKSGSTISTIDKEFEKAFDDLIYGISSVIYER